MNKDFILFIISPPTSFVILGQCMSRTMPILIIELRQDSSLRQMQPLQLARGRLLWFFPKSIIHSKGVAGFYRYEIRAFFLFPW